MTPAKVSLNFTMPMADVAALDEIALLSGLRRVDIVREMLCAGIMERLGTLPDARLFDAWRKAKTPVKPQKSRGKTYRLIPA